jgi:hypothetical protein
MEAVGFAHELPLQCNDAASGSVLAAYRRRRERGCCQAGFAGELVSRKDTAFKKYNLW